MADFWLPSGSGSRTQELKNSSTQERKNAAMRTSARELLVLLEFSSAFIPNSEIWNRPRPRRRARPRCIGMP